MYTNIHICICKQIHYVYLICKQINVYIHIFLNVYKHTEHIRIQIHNSIMYYTYTLSHKQYVYKYKTPPETYLALVNYTFLNLFHLRFTHYCRLYIFISPLASYRENLWHIETDKLNIKHHMRTCNHKAIKPESVAQFLPAMWKHQWKQFIITQIYSLNNRYNNNSYKMPIECIYIKAPNANFECQYKMITFRHIKSKQEREMGVWKLSVTKEFCAQKQHN